MNERSVYLDTSSIVKRYVEETGSRLMDLVYAKAEADAFRIVFSLWNIGEVLGVLDSYRSRRLLNDEAVLKALNGFLAESEKLMRLGGVQILPFAVDTLAETYALVLKHHIYQADALQIATCRTSAAGLFLAADKNLLRVAREERLEALNVETDAEKIAAQLR